MRKNALIKMLEKLDGNPEIMLWNGMVEDVVPIDSELVETQLVQPSLAQTLRVVAYEHKTRLNDWDAELAPEQKEAITASYKKHRSRAWTLNEFVTLGDVSAGQYDMKTVFTLQSKKSNRTYYNRSVMVEY